MKLGTTLVYGGKTIRAKYDGDARISLTFAGQSTPFEVLSVCADGTGLDSACSESVARNVLRVQVMEWILSLGVSRSERVRELHNYLEH